MWGLLPRSTQVLVVAGLGIIIAWALEGVSALITGAPKSPLHFVSLAATVITAGVAPLANRYWRLLWRRLPALGTWIFPDLNGNWEGTLVSTWIDPATGQKKPPIATTITVRQGLFSTSVRLQTGESTSYSTRCLLEADREHGRFRLWYSYDNKPKAEFRRRSASSEGVAWLEAEADPHRLVGYYYTERKTSGDIDVRRAI